MEGKEQKVKARLADSYQIRKISKSGNTRYLSVGRVLPPDWVVVKLYVISLASGVCVLRLEQIK